MKLPLSFGKPKKRSWLIVRRVAGTSMLPGLRPGRIVLAAARHDALKKGDVVIIRHNGLEKIKRIQQLRDARIFVVGDNLSSSTDSRSFGWLDAKCVAGKVIWPRI